MKLIAIQEELYFIGGKLRGIYMNILLWLPYTPGDDDYVSRWEKTGSVVHTEDVDVSQFDVLVCDFNTEITDEFLKPFKRLKFVATPTTGLTHIKSDLSEHGIRLVSLKGEEDFLSDVRSVSEFVLRQTLVLLRPDQGRAYGFTLNGKNVGIVGYGRIGRQVSRLFQAFGVGTIWKWDKDSTQEELISLFSKADIVTIHLEENFETKGLVDKNYLCLMKKTAILINTARGSIVEEDYAIKMVNEGRLLGFASDFYKLKPGEEFMADKDVLITQHIAGHTIEDRIKTDNFLAKKLELATRGFRFKEQLPPPESKL